jgi:glycosyltransferase involved in cell wall biosynthesis
LIVLLHGSRSWGAVENYTAEVLGGLREGAEDAVFFYPDVPELEAFAAASGGSVKTIPFPAAEILDASAPKVVVELARRLRPLRPRLVHVIDAWPGAMLAAWLARPERVLVTHHTPELQRGDSVVGRALWYLAWLTRPEVVYTSELDRRADGRSRLRTHVVYYGIDLDRFGNAVPSLPKTGPLIGCVARLVPQKGLHFLVEAAPSVLSRHPDARFVLVGDGELRATLEEQVRAAGLADTFIFTGHREDVPELVASLDVFALPSYFEGLCYAVIEAQAAGVPVVATPVGGIPENVVPGETGLLVPVGDPGALAEAISSLLDDPEEAARLAREARRRVFERYPIERMVEQTLRLYA